MKSGLCNPVLHAEIGSEKAQGKLTSASQRPFSLLFILLVLIPETSWFPGVVQIEVLQTWFKGATQAAAATAVRDEVKVRILAGPQLG